jgi:predicted nucleic acid-binding protein
MIGSSGRLEAVIDASFATRLHLPSPSRDRCRTILDQLQIQGASLIAPTLWAYEVTSVFSKAYFFHQITLREAETALNELRALGVDLIPPDSVQDRLAFDWTLRLKRAAAYDSYYLALAESRRCDLWTADQSLVNVSNVPWVRFVGAAP